MSYKHTCSSWDLQIHHYPECSMNKNKWRSNCMKLLTEWLLSVSIIYPGTPVKNLSLHFSGKWISHGGPEHWRKMSLDPHICVYGATWKTWHISKKCKHEWHHFITFFAAATHELMGAIHVVHRCARCVLRLRVLIWNVYYKCCNKSISKYLFTYSFHIYVTINSSQNWPHFAYL